MDMTTIPDGLELVTDPNITRLFPELRSEIEQQAFPFISVSNRIMPVRSIGKAF